MKPGLSTESFVYLLILYLLFVTTGSLSTPFKTRAVSFAGLGTFISTDVFSSSESEFKELSSFAMPNSF